MTCVLGMVVRREREIRSFEKTPFYRVIADITCGGQNGEDAAAGRSFPAEWRVTERAGIIIHLTCIRRMDLRREKKLQNLSGI